MPGPMPTEGSHPPRYLQAYPTYSTVPGHMHTQMLQLPHHPQGYMYPPPSSTVPQPMLSAGSQSVPPQQIPQGYYDGRHHGMASYQTQSAHLPSAHHGGVPPYTHGYQGKISVLSVLPNFVTMK